MSTVPLSTYVRQMQALVATEPDKRAANWTTQHAKLTDLALTVVGAVLVGAALAIFAVWAQSVGWL